MSKIVDLNGNEVIQDERSAENHIVLYIAREVMALAEKGNHRAIVSLIIREDGKIATFCGTNTPVDATMLIGATECLKDFLLEEFRKENN